MTKRVILFLLILLLSACGSVGGMEEGTKNIPTDSVRVVSPLVVYEEGSHRWVCRACY